MQDIEKKEALVEAIALLEPADLAAIVEVSQRLAAWNTAKSEARMKFGSDSEQHKKAVYHLRKIRNRLRQSIVAGGAFQPVNWFSDKRLAVFTKSVDMVEVH
jgi:hypothetical protein